MASTFSPSLFLVEPAINDPTTTNAWGALLNLDMTLIDDAITGELILSVAGGANVVLTSIQGQPDQARNYSFTFTGLLTADIVVLWPQNANRNFRATNSTTGAFTLSCGANDGTGLPAGATYSVPQGSTSLLSSDGTNVGATFNDGFLPLTGGTITGSLSIVLASGNANLTLDGVAGTTRQDLYRTAGINRFAFGVTGAAESGSNAGSNLFLTAFADNGASLGSVYSVVRSTRVMTLAQIPLFSTASPGSLNTQGANTNYVDTALLTAAAFNAATYYPISGGTITGNVTVGNGAVAAILGIDGVAGTARSIQFKSSGSLRWTIVTNNVAESGGNAGSNLVIQNLSDTGTLISTAISLNRASGIATLTQTPVFPTPLSTDNSTSGATTSYVQKNTPFTGVASSAPAGTGSYIKIATTTVSPTATQSFVLNGQVSQAFAGGAITWGLKFRIDNTTDVNPILSNIPQNSATLMGSVSLSSGSHTIDLYWLGQNASVTFVNATVTAQATQ